MNSILVLIIVVLSVLLIGIVLVQKSKGGGLAAGFQSANSTLGAPKTADFLEKASWGLMAVIACLCILCTVTTHKVAQGTSTQISTSAPSQMNENFGAEEATEAPAEAPAEAE